VATCLLGVFAGLLLARADLSQARKLGWLLAAGGLALVVGHLWGLQFPIVKKIWTSSFVLVTAGWSLLLLGAFYYVVDMRQWRRWCEPFIWIGMNPITLYLATSVIGFHGIARRFVGGDIQAFLDNHVAKGLGGLLVALTVLLLLVLFARFLHQRKIFLRV
jgi:predicted acyltransferase